MYQQDFSPVNDSLALSALFAALPLITIFILLGALKIKAQWAALASLGQGIEVDPMTTSYFLSRATVVPTFGGGMARWREKLFAQMHRNATAASDFLNLPANRVVELGTKVQI